MGAMWNCSEEAISEMDAFIAVTGNSETNIMSCLVAKSKGVKTIALVENMDYFQLSHSIGIDTLINKNLAANHFQACATGEVVAMTRLNNMNAELLEFIVTPSSAVCNQKVKEIDFPRSAIIGGVIRNNEGWLLFGRFWNSKWRPYCGLLLATIHQKVEKLFIIMNAFSKINLKSLRTSWAYC